MATSTERVGINDAKTANVDRILDDMISQAPKGSYIVWYTDLFNLERPSTTWSRKALPVFVANGVNARLVSDPSLARLERRVKRATDNIIMDIYSRDRVREHIKFSFSTAKATSRSKALAWKMFTKSREAWGLPNDVLEEIRVLIWKH